MALTAVIGNDQYFPANSWLLWPCASSSLGKALQF